MILRTFLPSVAVLLAALTLPVQIFAQSTNVKTPNKNQSAKFKSAIFKGSGNLIQSNSIASFIGGGQSNAVVLNVRNAVIGGGFGNIVSNSFGTVGGGFSNTMIGPSATIGGGSENRADLFAATIGGGTRNTVILGGTNAVIGGGMENTNSGNSATIGGGELNQATNDYATVAGGYQNRAGFAGTVGGGQTNTASGLRSVVSGGFGNTAREDYAVVGGGQNNTASGVGSIVGGGAENMAQTNYATVPGGLNNAAAGSYSLAAGRRAKADHDGCFVWADSTDADFSSGSTNQFLVRAAFAGINRNLPLNGTEVFGITSPRTNSFGGMYIRTSGAAAKPYYGYSVNGGGDAWTYVDGLDDKKWKLNVGGGDYVTVTATGLVGLGTTAPTARLQVINATCDGTTWQNASDRNLKTSFKPVDGGEILRKVAELPISEWTYKSSTTRSRHVGPTAQDFREIFGLGDNDQTISTIDPSGVALAAIQGLVEELKDRDKRIDELNDKLEAVEQRLNSLPPAP